MVPPPGWRNVPTLSRLRTIYLPYPAHGQKRGMKRFLPLQGFANPRTALWTRWTPAHPRNWRSPLGIAGGAAGAHSALKVWAKGLWPLAQTFCLAARGQRPRACQTPPPPPKTRRFPSPQRQSCPGLPATIFPFSRHKKSPRKGADKDTSNVNRAERRHKWPRTEIRCPAEQIHGMRCENNVFSSRCHREWRPGYRRGHL